MTYLNHAPVVHRRKAGPVVVVGTMASIFAAIWIVTGNVDQNIAAAMIGAILIGIALLQPRVAIVLTYMYLAVMGDVRRYIVSESGTIKNDPLLLVGPAVAAVLLASGLAKRRTMLRTQTSALVFALMIVMVLEMLNPLQGGLSVGLAGGLFFIVPLLWFWIGQAWSDSEFLKNVLVRVVVPLAVLASVLGLMQGTIGYLHYEAVWFRMTTESASRPDMRPFSFFCSWGEYPFYLGIALVVVLAPLFIGKLRVVAVLAPLFVWAMIVQSVREAILESLLALCVVWAVQGRSRATMSARLVLAGIMGLGLLVLGMTALKNVESKVVQQNLAHSADGFLEIENSTAGTHLDLIADGLVYGFTHPIGLGLGGPTIAGAAEGGFSSEMDFSDVFIACGVVGGILNLILMFAVLRGVIVYWRDHRDLAALYVLAIIVLELGHWLAGGSYATSAIVWFGIGTIDRMLASATATGPAPVIARTEQVLPLRSRFAPAR